MAFVAAVSFAAKARAPIASVCSFSDRTSLATPLRRAHVPARRPLTSMAAAEGRPAPDFSATDTDGNAVSLSGLRGSKVILFFMAGAGPGCTTQSCSLRDASAELTSLDAKIVAVSARGGGAAFKSSNSLNFPVIDDTNGSLQTLYGVPKTFGLIPGRVTYVIDKEGVVRKSFNSQFSIAQHVAVAKETVEKI